MAPIRPDHHDFAFKPETLDALRKRLELTQAALAEHLDVPVNTVSRWETGATTPDANALAAIFSVAKERGVTPQFFKRRATLKQKQPTQLLFAWDFQNRGLDASDVEEEWPPMRKYLDLLFPKTRSSRRYLAYTSPHQYGAAQELEHQGFQVFTGFFDADAQLIRDVKAACQSRPSKTVVFLVTDDGNFGNLLLELKQMGVEAYVWGTDECSERLRKALGDGNFVHWDAPFVITECVEVIKELKGKPIGRAEFGNRCNDRLEESEVYPGDVGFSRRNPYGSALRWLEKQGIVTTAKVSGQPDSVTIRLLH